jgi:Golgi apyrase
LNGIRKLGARERLLDSWYFLSLIKKDLGGASTQIAFEPTSKMASTHSNDLTSLKLRTAFGHDLNYRVFVTTFLGFGVNEARRRYSENMTTGIDDPCIPKGLGETKKAGDLESCIAGVYPLLNKEMTCPDKPCLFNGVHAPIEVGSRSLNILGFPESSVCRC